MGRGGLQLASRGLHFRRPLLAGSARWHAASMWRLATPQSWSQRPRAFGPERRGRALALPASAHRRARKWLHGRRQAKKMSFRPYLAAVVLTMAGLASPSRLAQRSHGPQNRQAPQILDKNRALLLWDITAELRLDPLVAPTVFEVLARHDRVGLELRRHRGRLMEELQAAIQRPADDASLGQLVERSLRARRERREAREARWRELRPLLSPAQQAKFLLMPRLDSSRNGANVRGRRSQMIRAERHGPRR
jgi:hypothetical protein